MYAHKSTYIKDSKLEHLVQNMFYTLWPAPLKHANIWFTVTKPGCIQPR